MNSVLLLRFFKSTLFNYVMRLAIVLVVFSNSVAIFAESDKYSKYVVKVADNSTGKGLVYVANNSETPAEDTYVESETFATHTTKTQGTATHTYYLYAKPKEGYLHAGWSSDPSGGNVESESNKNPYPSQIKTDKIDENNPLVKTM